MKKYQKARRLAALMLALLMALLSSGFAPGTILLDEVDVDVVDFYVESPEDFPVGESTHPVLPEAGGTYDDDLLISRFPFTPFDLDYCDYCDERCVCPYRPVTFEPFFIGAPPAPIFSHQGGVHASAFNLTISNAPGTADAIIRFAVDGSIPVDCGGERNPATNRCFTPDQYAVWSNAPGQDLWFPPECGCSWILEPGQHIPINYTPPWRYYSPMTVHGVGRANPGFWSVPWATQFDDGSAYTTPRNPRANWTAGPAILRHPGPFWSGGSDPTGFSGGNTRPPAGNARALRGEMPYNNPTFGPGAAIQNNNAGYYVPNAIYNGMVVRARSFDVIGTGGDTASATYLVNRPANPNYPAMNWSGVRIMSIVIPPEDFADPIRGFYRNWDRGFNTYSMRAGSPDEWINTHFYNWESQINAGLWDGRNLAGNPVTPIAQNTNFGFGSAPIDGGTNRGLPVFRRADGRALDMMDQEVRHIANVEIFNEQGTEIVNQLANTWVFGNFTRMFPIRSIRVNFNQGDGDIIGVPDVVPGTRRHFHAANQMVSNFRHVNARTADPDGTDLRDPLAQWISHPLRPLIQNATWGAVFVNGEFWGMYNMHTHRHEHLISEVFDVPRNLIQLEDEDMFIAESLNHIAYSTRERGVRIDNEIAPGGTRRTALGPDGYARTAPCGANHLTREWFDHLNTIFDMDDLIDYLIIGYHFENWDWIDNNMELWRTTHPVPGSYGGDGRWRFIVQDFDNAIFHGANNFLNFFTAMTSPNCTGVSCAACSGHPTADLQLPGGHACRGEVFHPNQAALPFDFFVNNSTFRRVEDSARIFRVLLQNPYFRNYFAARYSTYTGTVFHPNRTDRVIAEQEARATLGGAATPVMGRHQFRWGLLAGAEDMGNNGWGPVFAPWVGTGEQRGSATDGPATPGSMGRRATNWIGTTPGRWAPHTIRAPIASEDADPGDPESGHGITNPAFPAGHRLRSLQNVLRYRASHAATQPANQNSIEHMREYFTRNSDSYTGTSRAWYRENLPGSAAGLGGVGTNIRVNWRVNQSGTLTPAARDGDIGWLDVAGANIRRDLFEWGNLAAYRGAAPASFTPFSIGEFSARYLRNMPIEVTANALPGQRFSHFTVTGTARVYEGAMAGRLSSDGMSIVGGTNVGTGTVNSSTIIVVPTGTNTGTGTAGEVTVTAHFTEAPPTAIIHQVYGQGDEEGDNAISHGFIELYNPNAVPVSLGGRSLQIQNIGNNYPYNLDATDWEVLTLPNVTIPPRASFLVVSTYWYNTNTNPSLGHVPRLILEDWDYEWDIAFSNRNFSVALVEGTDALDASDASRLENGQAANVDDLVGVINQPSPRDAVHNVWGTAPAPTRNGGGISRQTSARRVHVSGAPQNTQCNYHDFEAVRFADLNRGEIEYLRPRSIDEGAWLPRPWTGATHAVTVQSIGTGSRAFPHPSHVGRIVGFTPGTPPLGYVFQGWEAITPANLDIRNADSLLDAYVIMPAQAITVRANFVQKPLPSPSVIINQVHGQGTRGSWANAISHGFIELYNPSSRTVRLDSMTLQVMNDDDGTWHVLQLPNHEMRPGTYFLVVSSNLRNPVDGHSPRHTIQNYDIDWNDTVADMRFSHDSLSAALVIGSTSLPSSIGMDDWSRVVDLVGARNENGDQLSNYLGLDPAMRMWRQGSARRRDGFQNTRNNVADFVGVDFRYPTGYTNMTSGGAQHDNGIDSARLEQVRPRWSGETLPAGSVTIINGGFMGAGVSHNPAAPGQLVTISAGYRGGDEFIQWTVQGDVTLAQLGMEWEDRYRNRITQFEMPSPAVPVVLVANWGEREVIYTSQSYDIVFAGPPSPYIFRLQPYLANLPLGEIVRPAGTTHIGFTHDENIVLTVGTAGPNARSLNVNRIEANQTRGLLLRNVAFQAGDVITVTGTVTLSGTGLNMRFQPHGSPNSMPATGTNPHAIAGSQTRTGGGANVLGDFTMSWTVPNTTVVGELQAGLRIISHGAAAAAQFRIDDITVFRPSLAGLAAEIEGLESFLEVEVEGGVGVVPFSSAYTLTGAVPGVAPLPPIAANVFHTLPSVLADGSPLPAGSSYRWRLATPVPPTHLGASAVTFNPAGTQIISNSPGYARVLFEVFGLVGMDDTQHPINVIGGAGAYASPPTQYSGQWVDIYAGAIPAGYMFNGWTGNATIVDSDSVTAGFVMPNHEVTVTANFVPIPPMPDILINQIYARRNLGTNAVSHSFIELYNPTNSPIDLAGLTLQIFNGTHGPDGTGSSATIGAWYPHTLTGTIPANSSFLIVATPGGVDPEGHSHRVLTAWDLALRSGFLLSNSSVAAAIVVGSEPLPNAAPISHATMSSRVVDLVGVVNTPGEDTIPHWMGAAPATRVSRQEAARRIDLSNNTGCNATDFQAVRFTGATDDHWDIFGPRTSADGPWLNPPSFPVTVVGGAGASATSNPAPAGTTVFLSAGAPPNVGDVFMGWTADPDVTIQNADDPSENAATFVMPNGPVTVTANWQPLPGRSIAEFSYTRQTANVRQQSYPATGGTLQSHASLKFFYSCGLQADIGRTQADREPVNVPNHATARWFPEDEIDANNSAGWVITLNTLNYENLTFTADQGSSNNGPRDFNLAFRIGTSGPFTTIDGTTPHGAVLSAADAIGNTFNEFSLPVAMENQAVVQLKVYISTNESRGPNPFPPYNNGNTSMNNIVIRGESTEQTYQLTVTGGTGSGNFAAGTSVTAVATVPPGQEFVSWTPTGITTLTPTQLASESVTFDMPANAVTLVAEFAQLRNLTVLGGGVGATPSSTHRVGATVNITPGTRANYAFDGWADVMGITIDPFATSFVMPDNDVSLTATWYSTITFPLTVIGGTGSGDFPEGVSVTATATVPPGYEFDGWTADGVTLTTAQLASESVTFNMPATAVTLTANFAAIGYQLTILDGGIGATPDGTHVAGATVNITPGTRDGYSFTGWTAMGVALTDSMATSFVMPAGAVTLTANWLAAPTLTAFSIDSLMLTEEIATAAEVIALLNDIAVAHATFAPADAFEVDDLNIEWSFVGEFTTSPGAVNVFTWTVTGPPGLVIPPELATGTINVINFIDMPTLISVTVPPITAFTAPTDDAAAAIAALEAAAPYAQAVISTIAAPVDLEITWAVVGIFDPAPGATNEFTWTVTPPVGVFIPDGVATSGTITVTNFTPPPITIGDLTGNGRISIMDVALLRTYVVDGPDTLTASVLARIEAGAGNVSGNTPLSMTDVEMLRTYVMGMGHTLDPAVQARLAWHTAQ